MIGYKITCMDNNTDKEVLATIVGELFVENGTIYIPVRDVSHIWLASFGLHDKIEYSDGNE